MSRENLPGNAWKIRILIADDHDIVRRGMRPLIESEWGWEICGEARDGRAAVEMAEKLQPDIVVLDVAMPELNGVEATLQIKRALPDTEVLAFTGTESETLVHQLFAAGARGCVLKSEAGEHLIPAIKALCAHEPYFGSHVAKLVFESYLKGGVRTEQTAPGGLTPREREIVQLLAEGGSNKDVAMQQQYATGCGTTEVLSLAEVIEDALRMNAGAFLRHGTQVVREFDAALPPIPLDRHKVLLILVNLIRNAKDACDDGGHAEKCITIRTQVNAHGCAKISISDNGLGIPPENLTRIFEHGFTTRKDGHGFGLHSSALAASEMGGSLRVHSDGPSTGATFTIELPLHSRDS